VRVLGEFAVRGEAGELRAGARAARGAVIGPAGAEDEVAGVPAGRGGAHELDVIDLRETLRIDGGADAPCDLGEGIDLGDLEAPFMPRREEEPVAAPGDVPGDFTDIGHPEPR